MSYYRKLTSLTGLLFSLCSATLAQSPPDVPEDELIVRLQPFPQPRDPGRWSTPSTREARFPAGSVWAIPTWRNTCCPPGSRAT